MDHLPPPGSPGWFFSSLAAGEKLVLLGTDPGSSSSCQARLQGPAGTVDVLQPGSELVPQLWGPVHAEEGGRPALEVSFSLHEGGEGGDTVANKVVGLAKDVQVDLGHLRLQAHHLHLQEGGQGVLAWVQAKLPAQPRPPAMFPAFSLSVEVADPEGGAGRIRR